MTQQNKICAEEYVVKRGDSFYLIAHKLGVPLRDLLAANRDIHPARLMVGDILCIPREEDDRPQDNGSAGSTGNTGSTGGTGNTGNAGSTGNAGNTGNTGTSGNTNTDGTGNAGGTGSTGTTGNAGSTSNAGSTGNTGNSVTAPDTTLSCPETEQYTVESGQTVADLQLKGLVSRHTLETANPGLNLDQLSVGQTVCIPKENVPCTIPETHTMTQGETLESLAVRYNVPVASLLRTNPCLAPQDFEEGAIVVLPR